MVAVNVTTDITTLAAQEQLVIAAIRQRNLDIRNGAVKIDLAYPGAAASEGFNGIRSAHGIDRMTVVAPVNATYKTVYASRAEIGDLYKNDSSGNKKVKLCWLSYAENAATSHAEGGIPTLIEFSGVGGSRILLEYARDLVIYTPDHYTTYQLVVQAGHAIRTM